MTITRLAILSCLALCSTVGAGVAHAAPPPPSPSAIDQYVEKIPTATGDKAAGGGTTKTSQAKQKADEKLRDKIDASGGPDAPLLAKVATSPTYGAPSAPAQSSKPASGAAKKPGTKSPGTTPAPSSEPKAQPAADTVHASVSDGASAAAETVTSTSDTRVLGLGIALVLVSIGALAVAIVRHRRNNARG